MRLKVQDKYVLKGQIEGYHLLKEIKWLSNQKLDFVVVIDSEER